MLDYEDEAKMKDCPFGGLRILACASTDERPANWEKWVKCGASDCAMWRQESMDRPTGRGYCGLAGKPE